MLNLYVKRADTIFLQKKKKNDKSAKSAKRIYSCVARTLWIWTRKQNNIIQVCYGMKETLLKTNTNIRKKKKKQDNMWKYYILLSFIVEKIFGYDTMLLKKVFSIVLFVKNCWDKWDCPPAMNNIE